MSNIIPITQARMPAAMRARMAAGTAVNTNLSEGVRDAFPLLSIKGKVFRIRLNGQETPLIDQQTRQAIPFLDVVLVNGSRTLSKSYYEKGFTEGDFDAPLCWSMDSIRPDPSVPNKVSPTCISCPKNVFGSRITEAGKAAKACQDARRVAVIMPGHLGTTEPMVFMLRVPQSSLKNLKAYSQLLERQGWETNGCITRLAFDYQEAYPKLVFNFVDGLDDKEYDEVVTIAENPATASMLVAPDYDQAVTTPPQDNPNIQPRVRQDAPVMETDLVRPRGEQQTQGMTAQQVSEQLARQAAVQETPPLKAVEPVLIELPDGKLYNPATGEYVDRAEPQVEMPAIDPNTIALPEGRFYNKTTNKFVVGPEVGAKGVDEAVADTPPVKRTRAPAKKKEAAVPPATQKATPEQQQATSPQDTPAPEAKQRQQVDLGAAASPQPVDNQQQVSNGADVAPTPAGLDDLLKSVLPSRPASHK